MITVYGDHGSGNCLKVRYVATLLDIAHEWIDVNITRGETRTPEFLALNPAGQIPLVVLEDGRTLAQSNAILLYLARDSELVPRDPWRLAQVHQWLFWEQYSHEPAIAVARFQRVYLGKPAHAVDSRLIDRGDAALDLMEGTLANREWLVEPTPTVADVALLAYTRLAHEGGFDTEVRPAVRDWVSRCESWLSLEGAAPA